MNKNETVLSRWSRRKLQSDQQTLREDVHIELQQELGEELPELEMNPLIDNKDQNTEPEVLLTDADMPDIETLDEDSDFSGFMSAGVSDELRNLALRKLFRAPAFNICDGLDEYDEDYTTFEKLGDIITCDMQHQIEMEAQKKLEKQREEAQSALEDSKVAVDEAEDNRDTESTQQTVTPDESLPHHQRDSEETRDDLAELQSESQHELKSRDLA